MASEVFIQEIAGISQTLRFEDARLVLAIADARGARELSLPYYEIDVEQGEVLPASQRLRVMVFGLSLLAAAATMVATSYLRLALAAATAGACAFVALRKGPPAQTRYALLDPKRRGEALTIWRDGQHERIETELLTRWKALRREIVRVDFAADPGRESDRFRRLQQRGVVSAEECSVALARIAAGAQPA